jgi:hypothetical protein
VDQHSGLIDVYGLILAGAKPFDPVLWGRREATPEELIAAREAREMEAE